MLDSVLSLKEMERAIGNAILRKKGRVRTIGDLELTNEDYKLLELRFRGFSKYRNDLEVYEKYSLCLLTLGTFYFKVESDWRHVRDVIQDYARTTPQHLQRRILEVFDNTVKEYSLSNPGVHLTNVNQLIQLFLFYSYDNESAYQKYFSELDKYIDGGYTDKSIATVNKKVFYREEELFEEEVKEKVFTTYHKAYLDCIQNHLSVEEMMKKYYRLSNLFVTSCCRWCEERDAESRMKIVK
ncbi:MAG: hypothetical protein IKL07_03965 [Clostridium sp.]|nr:hypothetical protein [Clostridium sp.]